MTQETKKLVRNYVRSTNQTKSIAIGMSRNVATVGTSTPIEIIEGDQPPTLEGRPYLKTQFRNGGFSKTLYTPSTLKVTVGKLWLEAKTQC
jgi:hypothetical protein